MLAGSSARILRYIVVAGIILMFFYLFPGSRYETLPRTVPSPDQARPASQPNPQNAAAADRKVDSTQKPMPADRDRQYAASPKPAAASTDAPAPIEGAVDTGPRANATFVTLARNVDVWDIARSIRQVEDRFNRRFNYDWVFLNDKPFDENFRNITSALVSGTARYGQIPIEHWSVPDWIDEDKAKKVREDMKERKIIYGDSISYRHMCRFESGFFFQHPIMQNYDFYWRVEPSIELFCDIPQDPFRFMKENGKKYSFTISLLEYVDTIPTLWDSAVKFMENYPQHVAADNSMEFLSDDGGQTYSMCHFWSNFEIGSLEWMRSDAYVDFFNSLDQDGGFFYERWGDAPVHSIAAGILLNKTELHFFDEIAYFHMPFTHCPNDAQARIDLKCHCNPKDNFDWSRYSCTSRYFEMMGMQKPDGVD
ncbi:Glycosyl transferase, family 15 [Cordyceps fumosorosea ARSEF 2679]|uniref:Glycosyl transferase, family 15 n=1 Tax=Cordyceps fumosorosea (strain ARSEF 2679) TaxID=1081104 RepID=A0A162JIL4_CORFA|nr:Glycosyl transferase, family 15 [Cordyceps fumosorosea ARSEF 2679]OAA69542.1 Glycosyl transferase, family 15 [Cordyceps fumosorosea ARSEF 2679]